MYFLYLFSWKVVSILPERFAYGLAKLVADQVYRRNGKGVKRLRSNYQKVMPELSSVELEKLTRAGMRSYLRYWFDTFRLSRWNSERIIKTTTVINEHLLRDPILQKKGCIVAVPHAGNWDHAAAYFCSTGINLTAVVEELKPAKIFKKFLDYRQSIGIEAISHREKTIPILTQRLQEGNLIALVADRDMSRNGVEVNFFSHTAKMPAGPAVLALETGSPLVTAFVRYLQKGIEIIFEEITLPDKLGSRSDQVVAITQLMADSFAKRIKTYPVDWHMLQRIWINEEN